ncbi:unnamed protein product [Coccothraustes coccothraustes]
MSAHGVGGAGEGSGRYPSLCLARRGRNFKPRGTGATFPPAIRAASPARRGAGEGRGAEQIPRRSPIPPRQRRSRRVPAGRRRAGLRECAGSHRPARALFTAERRRAHMEVTAPTPISRERPAAAVQTARRGGSAGGGSEAGTRHHHAPSRRALRPPAGPARCARPARGLRGEGLARAGEGPAVGVSVAARAAPGAVRALRPELAAGRPPASVGNRDQRFPGRKATCNPTLTELRVTLPQRYRLIQAVLNKYGARLEEERRSFIYAANLVHIWLLCIFLHWVILRINRQGNLELHSGCGLAPLGSWVPHIPLGTPSQEGGEQRKKVESDKMGT